MEPTRTCREFIQKYDDPTSRVNCCTCVKFDRENGRCADEMGVVLRYEHSAEFARYDKEVRGNRGVFLGK